MDNSIDYSGYDLLAFATDSKFQNWVFRNEDPGYWEAVASEYPEKKQLIQEAVQVLQALRFKEEWPTEETVEASLKRALQVIDKKQQPAQVFTYRRWWWAAAIFLALIGGAYFFLVSDTFHPRVDQVARHTAPADILPGGNKATLTLADGSTVILDSTHNGNITQQGNVTVIKLDDGQLAYNPTTHNAPPTTLIYNTITTPRGGQYQVVLADGSKVWLNAASSLTFPTSFPGKERDVKITGEAYFEVAHNADKPFRVTINDMTVEVLGTHFNINGYADEGVVKTTLLEGKVKVEAAGQSALLKPGQQARLEISNQQLETRNGVDLDEVMAWKNGRFVFLDADIETVMRQLARWYNFNVQFKGEIKDKFHVEMTRNTNLSNVFKILEGTGGVHFEIKQNTVLVMP